LFHGNLVVGAEGPGGSELKMPRQADPISICHLASGDRWAGAEAQMAFLLRSLARRKEFSLSAILLNEGRLADEIRRCGIEVVIIPENEKGFLEIFVEAARYLRNKGIRILHSHRYKENLLAALLARRCGVPSLVRSQQGLAEPFKGVKRYKQALLQRVDRWVAGHATDRVIAASDDIRNVLIRNVSPERVITVHNAVDIEQTHSNLSLSEAKKRFGIRQDCRVVGIAGRLEPIKRVDIFLLAAGQIAAQLPDTRFVVVGNGSQEVQLRELARSAGLRDRVLFLGHRSDIHDVIRAFDVLVLCSDHEGLPTILLEALYLGVAAVARSVGGVPEVIQDDVNGLLIESDEPSKLAEACVQILTDDVRRKRLTSAGVSWVAERFSSERTAADVAQVYRSLCEAR
jgi:glycosyltransferase involved in cell wall biosynthesis